MKWPYLLIATVVFIMLFGLGVYCGAKANLGFLDTLTGRSALRESVGRLRDGVEASEGVRRELERRVGHLESLESEARNNIRERRVVIEAEREVVERIDIFVDATKGHIDRAIAIARQLRARHEYTDDGDDS